MAFIRDVDSDEHVYANPVSSFLQQVGKTSRRCLSKLVKELKNKVQARQERKKDEPPSYMQRCPRPKERQQARPPKPCNYNFHPVRDTLSEQRMEEPELTSPSCRIQRNRSCESISHRNTLTMLQATNLGLPTIPATADGPSTGFRTAFTKSTKILPNDATNRPLYPGRPQWSFKDIPEVLMPGSFAAKTEHLGLPLRADDMHAGRAQHEDELWFTISPAELPESSLSSCTPRLSQDQDSVSSVSFYPTQPVKSQISGERFTSLGSHLAVNAPILGFKPFRSTRRSFPPRIPSLIFRPGSPFAGGNFPWQ